MEAAIIQRADGWYIHMAGGNEHGPFPQEPELVGVTELATATDNPTDREVDTTYQIGDKQIVFKQRFLAGRVLSEQMEMELEPGRTPSTLV